MALDIGIHPPTISERLAFDPVWLLDLTFAGKVYHYATEPVQITKGSNSIQYMGGLEIDLSQPLSLFSESPQTLSIPVSVHFPDDFGALVAKGHDPNFAIGELSIHYPGRTWGERLKMLRGQMAQPQYGAKDEPIAFSIEQNPFEDAGILISDDQRVSADTWDNYDSNIEGRYYPIVFGTPGVYKGKAGADKRTPGSPALLVDNDGTKYVLIAGHHVRASTVKIVNTTTGNREDCAVTNTTDGLGQPVALAVISSAYTADTDTHFTRWQGDGGGLENDRKDGDLTGGGELLIYMLRRSTLEWDRGRTYAAARYLDRFKFAGYIDDAVAPFEWVKQNLLPLLPVSMIAAAEGIAPVVWRREATQDDAVINFTKGPDCVRSSPITFEASDPVNDLTLNFALRADDNSYKRSIRLTGNDNDRTPYGSTPSGGNFSNIYSRSSFRRFGQRAETISTEIVYDRGTAAQILQWKSRAGSTLTRSVSYAIGRRYTAIGVGDVVTITDPDVSLSDELAIVRDVQYSRQTITIDLVLLDDPATDNRLT